jgi:hypothetical protein
MNPGFPGDFSDEPDDSKEVAAEIIKSKVSAIPPRRH